MRQFRQTGLRLEGDCYSLAVIVPLSELLQLQAVLLHKQHESVRAPDQFEFSLCRFPFSNQLFGWHLATLNLVLLLQFVHDMFRSLTTFKLVPGYEPSTQGRHP